MNLNKTKYRLSAKNLFLTYPNCNLSVGLALNLLKFKLSNQIIVDYLLVSEPHSDGSLHLHVYLKLSKILNTYNPAYLDINILPFRFHGNYEAAKFPNRVMEYMLKNIKDKNDPNLLFSPSLSDRIGSLGQFLSFEETILKLAREGNIQIALDMYEKERPLEFIKSHMSIERSLRQIYLKSKGFNTKFKFSDFILPDDLRVLLENFDPNKTLILIGAPGTGKTQLILAFLLHFKFRPLMINNIDSLRFFDNNKHNAIVFDDCTWSEDIDREPLIKLIDSEVPTTHNVKHGSVAIDSPTPRFVISNSLKPWIHHLLSVRNSYNDPAVKRRIIIYVLKDSTSLIPSIIVE